MENCNSKNYKGLRYVPILADPIEWTDDRTYEHFTIVKYKGDSYTSKQDVPIGIDITNSDYWVCTGSYNGQIEQYRQEVEQVSLNVKRKADWYDNVSDLRSSKYLKEGSYVCTGGYYKPGDGGDSCYYVRKKTENDVDDGGSILVVNDLACELITNGTVCPEQFGAYGDGVSDDTEILQYVIDHYNNIEMNKTYNVNGLIIRGNNKNIYGYSFISNSDCALIFGACSNSNIEIFSIVNHTNDGIHISPNQFFQSSTVTLHYMDCEGYAMKYVEPTSYTVSGCMLNIFNFGRINSNKCCFYMEYLGSSSNQPFFNSNIMQGGLFTGNSEYLMYVNFKIGYSHFSNNVLNMIDFEAYYAGMKAALYLGSAHFNEINCRYETKGEKDVYVDGKCHGNTIKAFGTGYDRIELYGSQNQVSMLRTAAPDLSPTIGDLFSIRNYTGNIISPKMNYFASSNGLNAEYGNMPNFISVQSDATIPENYNSLKTYYIYNVTGSAKTITLENVSNGTFELENNKMAIINNFNWAESLNTAIQITDLKLYTTPNYFEPV